ncbi:HEPN/Toprim-associated domain-containing protein [Lactobacillus helveticus]|uniref:HEPN/Toprim-associated domain-containing protein n=1 Tax=Lactobacillus helveticus TaxID=1587 RepID=UPI00358DB352
MKIIKKVRYYLWDSGKLVIKCKWQYGYETTLSKIKQRLDLIGYSIMEVKKRYEEYVESYPGDASNFYSFNDLYNEYINLITNGRYSRTNIARTTRH